MNMPPPNYLPPYDPITELQTLMEELSIRHRVDGNQMEVENYEKAHLLLQEVRAERDGLITRLRIKGMQP